jgi:hypothetical protein
MASDELRIPIKGDADSLLAAVHDAEGGLKGLGGTVDKSDKKLNIYGERLGKVFGKGEGLHGRLDALEMPLRDVEGGFDRARQTAFVFGNSAESASEKATQGFLLAADAIAAFTSGGVAGIAITAAVAGFALLAKSMQDEAAAAEEAKKAQEEHIAALQKLGESAADAGMSIAALNAQEAAQAAIGGVRAAEEELRLQKLKLKQLKDERDDRRLMRREAVADGQLATAVFDEESAAVARRLALQEELIPRLENAAKFARTQAKQDTAFFLNDLKLSQESAVTAAVDGFRKLLDQGSKQMEESGEKAVAIAKQQSQKIKEVFDLDAELASAYRAAQLQDEEDAAFALLDTVQDTQNKRIRIIELANAKDKDEAKKTADFKSKLEDERTELAKAAASTVSNALFQQAKDGELNAEKLLEAVLSSTGQELVARGTLHAFEGVATLNPVMAGTGAAMIASGLAMGAASGAISRAGQPAATPASTPTDTRQSRAASSGSGGEGGTTVINFNGPAYDKRGVANVLNAGQKMARHRRIAGA